MKFPLKKESIQSIFRKNTVDLFQKRRYVLKQAAIMTGARALGLALGAVGSVWAARCLGPKNLGISGMVQNVVGQTALVLGLISPTVLIREYKNAASAKTKIKIIQATNGFFLLLSLGFCVIAALFMAFKLVPGEYHFAGWLFLPIILLTSIQPAWLFQAEEKQHFQSVIAVLQPALAAVVYLLWFKPGMSAGDDLLVYSIVALFLLVIYWSTIYQLTPLKGPFFRFDLFSEVKTLILKSRWFFVSALSIYIYTVFEQPLLGWLYSLEELGKYRTALTVISAANSFFIFVPNILYPRFIEWKKRGEDILWRRQMKLAALFLFLGSGASILGFILIPFFYPIVYGPAFVQAALPCSILLASKIIVVITGIFYWGLVTDDRHDKYLAWVMIGTALISLTANIIFIPKWGMVAAATIDLLSELIILIACFWASANKNGVFNISTQKD